MTLSKDKVETTKTRIQKDEEQIRRRSTAERKSDRRVSIAEERHGWRAGMGTTGGQSSWKS